jgi:hypothetical protein
VASACRIWRSLRSLSLIDRTPEMILSVAVLSATRSTQLASPAFVGIGFKGRVLRPGLPPGSVRHCASNSKDR